MLGHGGSSVGSYLADPTSPIPSHCASIVMTSTLRVKGFSSLMEVDIGKSQVFRRSFPYTTPGHYSENLYLITLIFQIVPLGLYTENSGSVVVSGIKMSRTEPRNFYPH